MKEPKNNLERADRYVFHSGLECYIDNKSIGFQGYLSIVPKDSSLWKHIFIDACNGLNEVGYKDCFVGMKKTIKIFDLEKMESV